MSLSSAARIAQSSLNAVTAETSVHSRNISGASSTTFFSRKTINVLAAPGSQVLTVTRATNLAVFDNLLRAASAKAREEAVASGLDMLNQTIGDISSTTEAGTNTSPAALLSNFTNALQLYESSPSNPPLASAAIEAARSLTQGLNSASTIVSELRQHADSEIAASVQKINALLAQVQTVTREIVSGIGAGADVTDAQDRRDNILIQLAQEIGITATTGVNGSITIYTDGGVTLFQGGTARAVTFQPVSTYTPATAGEAVIVDGIPVTGPLAAMPCESGRLAGLSALRDHFATVYQAQLDGIARALIESFAESDQLGTAPNLPGLFTAADMNSLPTSSTGLAQQLQINSNADPQRSGNPLLLRDGGICGNPNYTYNQTGDAGYQGRLSELLEKLSSTQTFHPAGEIGTNASLSGYASQSVSWLQAQRSNTASQQAYQNALHSTASAALSNETGVNLDTEMSKMLDLERSYSATAKLIATIDGMFATLLASLERASA
ncbi:MAG TPA: flagellar hook-associated protein FlgK [Methylocella sp.]|nr:flagellar hook-associated protein FlgK [Methylocella sp.]